MPDEFINTREVMGDRETLDALLAHTLTDLKENGTNKIGQYAFYKNSGLESVEFPEVTTIEQYAFNDCTNLTTAKLPKLASASSAGYLFDGCKSLTTAYLPLMASASTYMFRNCTALASLSLPALKVIQSNMFDGCTSLYTLSTPKATTIYNDAFKYAPFREIDLPALTSLGSNAFRYSFVRKIDITKKCTIPANAFTSSYNLTELILRGDTMSTLSATNAFTGTPIAAGNGWIYVPEDLVDTYKAGTNWSTYAAQIVSINEYPKAITALETILDNWEQILAAEEDGSYSSKYQVGDTKMAGDYLMQIVAMDADELTAGGNAKITWLCKNAIEKRSMNATLDTTGGWLESDMRDFLRNTILPSLPETVRNAIKTVNKTYKDYGSSSTKTCEDTIWIPSYREMFGGTSYETSGTVYTGLFTSNSARKKYYGNVEIDGTHYFLRSAASAEYFKCVGRTGSDAALESFPYGVIFGFCT